MHVIPRSRVLSLTILTLLLFTFQVIGGQQEDNTKKAVSDTVRQSGLISQALVEAVKRASPSVVNIVTVKFNLEPFPELEPRLPGQGGKFTPEKSQEPENLDPMRKTGIGSGIVIKMADKNYVLTNHHVVYGVDRIVIRTEDRREFDAQVKGWDSKVDIAVLEVPDSVAKQLTPLALGNSDDLQVGEFVLAIGSPFGLQQSVTIGIVSAIGRYGQGIEEYEDFIQTDAAINRGNSGGPLLNLKGEVVGLNTAIRTTHMGGNVGIGFAIPVNMIKPVAEQLIRTGQVTRGWLGASVQNMSDDLAQAFSLSERSGVVVTKVVPGTPAERGGLAQGDIILRVEDEAVPSVNKLRNYIASKLPESRVKMTILRRGKTMTVNLAIGEAPFAADEFRPAPPKKWDGLGLTVQDVTKDIATAAGLVEPGGALIAGTEAGSPAALARPVPLIPGDVIVEVDRIPIKNAATLREMLKKRTPGESVLLLVCRRGNSLFTVLRIPEKQGPAAN